MSQPMSLDTVRSVQSSPIRPARIGILPTSPRAGPARRVFTPYSYWCNTLYAVGAGHI